MRQKELKPGDRYESKALVLNVHSVDMERIGEEVETSIGMDGDHYRTDIRLVDAWIEATGAQLTAMKITEM